MAVTLADFRAHAGDDVNRIAIDSTRRDSFILDRLPFVAANAPVGGGALAFTWLSAVAGDPATARNLNANFSAADEATTTPKTVLATIVGKQFGVDRVLLEASPETVAYQLDQARKETVKKFHSDFGAAIVAECDGDQAYEDAIALHGITSQADAFPVLAQIDDVLSRLDTTDGAIMVVSRKVNTALQNVARAAGYLTHSEDAFGRRVFTYAGVPVISSVDVVDDSTIIAARLATDGVHGITPAGSAPLRVYLPEVGNGNGASVLTGTVEMVSGVAVRTPLAAVVASAVEIAPAPEPEPEV